MPYCRRFGVIAEITRWALIGQSRRARPVFMPEALIRLTVLGEIALIARAVMRHSNLVLSGHSDISRYTENC